METLVLAEVTARQSAIGSCSGRRHCYGAAYHDPALGLKGFCAFFFRERDHFFRERQIRSTQGRADSETNRQPRSDSQ